jgi:hypothetical protein
MRVCMCMCECVCEGESVLILYSGKDEWKLMYG